MQWPDKLFWSIFLLLVSTLIQACAAKPYLAMSYQLPAPSASQIGKKACLTVADTRDSTEIFEDSARKVFKDFNGTFNLTVLSIDDKSRGYGNIELEMLFQKALEERLRNMGIEILSTCSDQQPSMRVEIKIFKINLSSHKWKAKVAYEASLTTDGRKTVKESVTGNAERVKLVGSKAAETAVAGLFTDVINRLDINRLFDQSM